MWGYYANGFKGIAIEIEVDCKRSGIRKVSYAREVAKITNGDDAADAVERILTTKLSCWRHEFEYRYIEKSDRSLRQQHTAVSERQRAA